MDAEPNYAMKGHYKNLMKDRENASSRGNGVDFYRLSNELGMTPEGEAEVLLYEQGQADAMYLKAQEDTRLITSRESANKLEKIARIALKRFPELDRHQHILTDEISNRLSEIRKAGYDVPAYSKLNAEEKWQLLSEIRRDIGSKIRTECPEVADEIDAQNKEQKYEGREFR